MEPDPFPDQLIANREVAAVTRDVFEENDFTEPRKRQLSSLSARTQAGTSVRGRPGAAGVPQRLGNQHTSYLVDVLRYTVHLVGSGHPGGGVSQNHGPGSAPAGRGIPAYKGKSSAAHTGSPAASAPPSGPLGTASTELRTNGGRDGDRNPEDWGINRMFTSSKRLL